VLADARQCLEKETSQTKQYLLASGSLTVFLEVLVPDTHLVLCGGNYDIYPLVRMAGELGWKTTVVMNPARADKSLFEMADVHPASRPQLPVIDRYTAVVLMAHDYEKDFTRLQAVLPTAARYIGLLGPRKRSQKMFDALAATGAPLSEANLQRIHAPAGLDIGAATPEEIALSILAEIRAHFNGRAGMPLRQRSGTIYGD
jgi:xanthine/CO dehydrogenase XdhC/CoxF family maturation factor